MNVEQRVLYITQLAAIAIIAIGCYMVLRPFFSAILFAIVVCVSTWPLYLHLRKWLRCKSSLAALLMILLLVLVVIVPSALLSAKLMDNVTALVSTSKQFLERGLIAPPPWIKQIPLIGEQINDYWLGLASGGKEAVALFTQMVEPARKFILVAARAIGHSVLQMIFAAFIGFYFYRDGEALLSSLRNGLIRLAGRLGEDLLVSIHQTVAGVVQGIFGAALAQSIMATVGFLIAGVPGAFLLGAATFILSLIPVGPPLVWGGASLWLFNQGDYGWAIFLVLWGVLVISSIDNIVKPYLISQSNRLSLLVNVLGVFGGIIAFGFIGIFIGPPILVVGLTLARLWTTLPKKAAEPQ